MAMGSPNSGAPDLLRSGEKVSVRAEALTLARGDRVLVEGLSFAAEPGDYIEVRGANGSGKTTLLRTIAGLAKPLAGEVNINAEQPELAVHLLGHRDGLKPTESVRQHLNYWRGLLSDDDLSIHPAILSHLGLDRVTRLPVRVLSQGQQRRLSLGRLLMVSRPVWLLDEPAAALDTAGRELVDTMIAGQIRRGGIVIAAVHEALGVMPTRTIELSA